MGTKEWLRVNPSKRGRAEGKEPGEGIGEKRSHESLVAIRISTRISPSPLTSSAGQLKTYTAQN